MAIVKTKKQELVQTNLRMPVELQQRINEVYDAIKSVQQLNKTDLIKECIERGLTSIENDLNASR